jgi:hypothetical protein
MFYLKSSGSALGPIEYPTEWAWSYVLGGKATRGVKQTTHLHLLTMLRMTGTVPLLSFMP